MISVKLNNQEYSQYLLDVNIDINESWLGKLDPNTATVKLDNSNGLFYINQYGQVVGPNDVIFQEGITATIDIDGIRKFTGYVDKQPKFSIDKKQISLSLKDKWKQFEKKRCENKVYLSTAFLTVLNDLVTQAGEIIENTNFENPELTINYWYVNEEKSITDALTELVKSVGGQLYYNENGILIFKAGFKSTFTTEVVDTFTVSNISGDFELSPNGEKYEQVEVSNKRKTLSNKLEYVYIGATEDQPFEVPPEGLPPDANDKFLAKFDDPVWWLEYYAGVEFAADAGISLNETKYNDNFLDHANHILKNPFELDLRVDNTSGITGNITDFKIKGKKVVEEEDYYLYPIVSTNEKYTFDTELISDRTWGESLAKWLYEEVQVKPKVEIKVADFASGLNLNIGEKILVKDTVSGISHRYVIHRIKINYKNSSVTINAVQDRDAFVYDPSIVKQSKSSANAELQPLTQDISQLQSDLAATQQQVTEVDNRTSYLDSTAPSTPTNITLSSNIVEGQSTVTVSFIASPEADVIYYEVAYTFDGIHWETVTTSDVSITFEAIANKNVWVKVRSVDAEGYFSAWSTVQSVQAAKDLIPPSVPAGLTVTEYFQKIRVLWNENTEEDMKDYIVQVSTYSDFSTNVETYYVDATYFVYSGQTSTTYYFRVKARDTSLNESDWTATVSGTTVKAYDEDIESAILNQAAADINTLNTVTIPALQTDIDAKLPNEPLVISETHIQDNAISTRTIQAEAITANEIASGTITAGNIGANQITANHIGANEIITNSANIGTAVIDTVHIKTAAIKTAQIADLNVTNAKIADLAVDNAKIANLDAAKITSGYIDADRIAAGTITAEKLSIQPPDALPNGTIAYWTNSLTDEINGIAFAGIEEQHLNNWVTLTPENAPEGSIVGELLAADKIYANHIAAGTITADKLTSNFTISAGQYIQAGDANRNYKLDGTQGLIRTIGSNTYNIFSYVLSGEANFDGTVTYKDIDLTNYGLTDYIAILNFQQTQFWRSEWTTSKNLTLTYEKISSNILRILAYFSDEVVWITKTGPTISFTYGDSWHTLVTTAADTTGAQVYWTATRQDLTESNTLTHYYRIPGTYTIKVQGNGHKRDYINIDWGDGIITTDGPYVASWFAQHDYSAKYVAEGHSGNPQPLWGKINYTVLGY
jgi:hypothetical protein